MGTPMATHLMDKGNSLVVYDINKAAVERFKAKGAQEASCPAEMALMTFDPQQLVYANLSCQ